MARVLGYDGLCQITKALLSTQPTGYYTTIATSDGMLREGPW